LITATIKNLTVHYAFDEAVGTQTFGGIAGMVFGGVTIYNCGNITESINFKDCNTMFGYGGLVGYAQGRFDIITSYSLTTLNIEGSKASVGGLIGRVDDFEAENKIFPRVRDSYFGGKINLTTSGNEPEIWASEIVGRGYNENQALTYIKFNSVYSIYDMEGNIKTNIATLRNSLSDAWVSDISINNGLPIPKNIV